MISEKPPGKYKDSKMKEIYTCAELKDEATVFIKTAEDDHIIPNTHFDSVGVRFFFFDKADLDWITSPEWKNQSNKVHLKSLEEFMKIRPEKRIYFRYVPLTDNRIETRRVLPEEVLEIIPLVLKQQKTPISDKDERIQKLREKWIKCRDGEMECGSTIDIREFEDILEEFDVNKELITLINDPFYTAFIHEQLNGKKKPITFVNAHIDQVMFPSQAILFIFQSFVCNINWRKLLMRADSHNIEYLRMEIIKYLFFYNVLDSSSLVRQTDLDVYVDHLKNVSERFNVVQEPYWCNQFNESTTQCMLGTFFRQECAHFGLENFAVNPDGTNYDFIHLNSAKVYLLLGWIDCFLDEKRVSIRNKIMDAMVYRMEESGRERLLKFWDTVPPVKPMYKESKFREYSLEVETVVANQPGVYIGDYTEIEQVAPNLEFFVRKGWVARKMKFFTLDLQDMFSVVDLGKTVPFDNRLDNLKEFLKYKPNKRIFIRTVSMISNGTEVRRVPTEEVLEIIPLVLKQQGCPIFNSNDRLEKYRELWKPVQYGKSILSKTIDMDELVKVMEEFDIDKDLITVVSDMSFEMSSRQLLKDGCTPITFISYDCQPVMFTGQALLYIFHTVICGVNWKIKRDIGEYDQMLRSLILKYSEMDQNLVILKKTVVEDITHLLTHRPPEFKPLPSEGAEIQYKLLNFANDNEISSIDYSRTCDIYGLDYLIDITGKHNLPLLMARQNYYMGFVNSFFKSEDSRIKRRLRDEFLWKTCKNVRAPFYQYVTNVCEIDNLNIEKPGTNWNGEEETNHMNSAMRPAEKLIEREEAKIKTERNSVQRCSEDVASTSGSSVIERTSAEEKTKEIPEETKKQWRKLGGNSWGN